MLSLQFNRTTEYAMRAMAALALQPDATPLPVQALSASTGIPRHYLSKIMKHLVEAGLVHSQKGHGGGFVLGRPRDQIRYIDILRAAGHESQENRCVFGWGQCSASNPCALHESWSTLNAAFDAWATENTLATVKRQPTPHQER